MTEAVTLDVLVADDDPSMLRVFHRISNQNGDRAELVGTTAQALELLRQGKKYDLVFTDLNQYPTGIDVYNESTSRGIEACIVSGGSDDQLLVENAQRVAGNNFIWKPFEVERIREIYENARAKKTVTPPFTPPYSPASPSDSASVAGTVPLPEPLFGC